MVVHIIQISCLSLTCGCMQLFLPSIKPQRPGESTSTLRCVHRCPSVARQHQARPHCRPQMAPHRWREGQSGCMGRRHRMNVRGTVCDPLPTVRRVPFAHQQGSCMCARAATTTGGAGRGRSVRRRTLAQKGTSPEEPVSQFGRSPLAPAFDTSDALSVVSSFVARLTRHSNDDAGKGGTTGGGTRRGAASITTGGEDLLDASGDDTSSWLDKCAAGMRSSSGGHAAGVVGVAGK